MTAYCRDCGSEIVVTELRKAASWGWGDDGHPTVKDPGEAATISFCPVHGTGFDL